MNEEHNAWTERKEGDAPLTRRHGAERGLALARPLSTSPRDVIAQTSALIKARADETVGYGVALYAFNMAINGFIQGGVYVAFAGVITTSLVAFTAHEVAGIVFMSVSASLVVGITIFVSLLIQLTLMGGYRMLWLKMLRDEPMDLDDVRGMMRPLSLKLTATGVLGAMVKAAGLFAFILPGVFLFVSLALAPFFVIDHGMSAREALRASHEVTRGHRLDLFKLLLLLFMANTLGLLTCGLGFFVSYPLSLGALAAFYDRVTTPGRAYAAFPTPSHRGGQTSRASAKRLDSFHSMRPHE